MEGTSELQQCHIFLSCMQGARRMVHETHMRGGREREKFLQNFRKETSKEESTSKTLAYIGK
jgi:hypothetical protein